MKILRIVFATLLLTLCVAEAVPPTGTVYRVVQIDTNGVLVNAGTNLVARNGIATTGSVAAAMGQAQLGATNVTGLLTFTDRIIGLTAAAVSNAMAGVYALVDHLHSYTAISNAPWATTNDVTNSLNLAVSPSLTNPVALAASALQAEVDTLAAVLNRGLFATNSVGRTVNILGSPSPVSFVVPQSWFVEFENFGGRTNCLGVDAADYFIRVDADGVAYRVHDDGSFAAGTDYLSPSGSGTSLTGLASNPGLTNTVALAASALLSEADTLQRVLSRGATASNSVIWLKHYSAFLTNIRGYNEDYRGGLRLAGGSDAYAPMITMYASNNLSYPDSVVIKAGGDQTPRTNATHGIISFWTDGTLRYFIGNTNGLLVGSGSALTDLTPSQIGAVWRTNKVLGIDGTTNTIIYLGQP
jgi:hypothetical protein